MPLSLLWATWKERNRVVFGDTQRLKLSFSSTLWSSTGLIPNVDLIVVRIKVKNIGFDGYIGTWILRIYRIYPKYISGYFYMNIDILEINKNTLKFMKILYKSAKMTLIIKYTH